MKNKIKKVNIEALLSIIAQLYDNGVDFVDIEGITEGDQDTIRLSFTEEYVDPEFLENFDTLDEILPMLEKYNTEEIKVEKLTDKDIDQLLS